MGTEFWVLAMLLEALCGVAVLAWRERVNDRERRDLLNRLMAGDYERYQAGEEQKPPGAVRNWLRGPSEKAKGPGKEREEEQA